MPTEDNARGTHRDRAMAGCAPSLCPWLHLLHDRYRLEGNLRPCEMIDALSWAPGAQILSLEADAEDN
jgi:hypothetical protein